MEGEKSLKKLYTNSMACEEKAFSAMRGMVETWQYQADFTQMIRQAINYWEVPEVFHTENKWLEFEEGNGAEISNRVYCMKYYVFAETVYNVTAHKSETVSWRVQYSLCLDSGNTDSTWRRE